MLSSVVVGRKCISRSLLATNPQEAKKLFLMSSSVACFGTSHPRGIHSKGASSFAAQTPSFNTRRKPSSSPGPTSLSSSLERLLPRELDGGLPRALPREAAEEIVQMTLESLLESTRVSSLQEGKLLEERLRQSVIKILPQDPLITLHSLSLHILRASSDPRRHPIAHRLFHISSGLDPYEFALGWSPDSSETSRVFAELGLDGSPRGQNGPLESLVENRGGPHEDSLPLNVHEASLSLFSSLILALSAPPPPGTSSLHDKALQNEMRLGQKSAALRIYARLAESGGDGGALFGWGMARLQALERSSMTTNDSVEVDEAHKGRRDREMETILSLWQKAAEKGVKEGWFELGRLYLTGVHLSKNEKVAIEFFEKGAEAGSSRSHHALGVLHAQVDSTTLSISTSEKAEKLRKSYQHFLAAAEMGDAQSAHNVGVRHLLTEVPLSQEDSEGSGANSVTSSGLNWGEGGVGLSQEEKRLEEALKEAIASHEEKWGVKPDDELAKRWFGVATKGGRGSSHVLSPATIDPMPSTAPLSETSLPLRLEELKQAETIYMRVIGMGGMRSASPASETARNSSESMTQFAQEALKGVRELIAEELEKQR